MIRTYRITTDASGNCIIGVPGRAFVIEPAEVTTETRGAMPVTVRLNGDNSKVFEVFNCGARGLGEGFVSLELRAATAGGAYWVTVMDAADDWVGRGPKLSADGRLEVVPPGAELLWAKYVWNGNDLSVGEKYLGASLTVTQAGSAYVTGARIFDVAKYSHLLFAGKLTNTNLSETSAVVYSVPPAGVSGVGDLLSQVATAEAVSGQHWQINLGPGIAESGGGTVNVCSSRRLVRIVCGLTFSEVALGTTGWAHLYGIRA